MADLPILKVAGIYTSANEYSAVPEGALSKANNCVIRSPHIIEPRRGQKRTTYSFGASTDRAYEIFFYGSTPIIHYGTLAGGVGTTLSRDTGAAFSNYTGTYSAPDATLLRMKAAEAQQCFYFTTSTGVMMLDAVAGTPELAGIPRALEPEFYDVSGTGWMLTDNLYAYRVVWLQTDAFGRELISAPSSTLVAGGGASDNCELLVPTVHGADSTWRFRVYRSLGSGSAAVQPSNDVYLAYEGKGIDSYSAGVGTIAKSGSAVATVTYNSHPYTVHSLIQITSADADFPSGVYEVLSTTANTFTYNDGTSVTDTNASAITIASRSIHFTDTTPESLLGDPLYTNPTDGEGDLSANDPPPLAHDIVYWNNSMWYANTESKQRFFLKLFGSDIDTGDTITIGGITFTATTISTTYNDGAAAASFDVDDGSVAASDIIEYAAKELVKAINYQKGNSTFRAYYTSGADDTPGNILIESIALGASPISVYTSNPEFFHPLLTTSSSGALTSSDDAAPNRLYYSKRDQPEAVPLLNYLDIGAKAKKILRIVPLRDRLYVFKEDGIFVVSGQFPYRVDLLDDTVIVRAPDSVQSVSNQIFAWTNQGVVAVTDAGARVVSKPIDRTLSQVSVATDADVKTFGVSYESERQYMLCFGATNGYSASQYVYNITSNTWTHWDLYRLAGRVNKATDLLYMSPTNGSFNNRLVIERKSMTNADFAEDSFSGTLTIVGSEYRVPTPTTCPGAQVGSLVLGSSSGGYALVTAVSVSGGNERMTLVGQPDDAPLETGETITVYNPFPCSVEWLAQAPGGPNQVKQFSEVTYHFRKAYFYSADAYFSTYGGTPTAVEIAFADAEPATGTGESWETIDASGTSASTSRLFPRNKRLLVPRLYQMSTDVFPSFFINEAGSVWALNGLTLHFNDSSERNSR
jgi:hypothetical protein